MALALSPRRFSESRSTRSPFVYNTICAIATVSCTIAANISVDYCRYVDSRNVEFADRQYSAPAPTSRPQVPQFLTCSRLLVTADVMLRQPICPYSSVVSIASAIDCQGGACTTTVYTLSIRKTNGASFKMPLTTNRDVFTRSNCREDILIGLFHMICTGQVIYLYRTSLPPDPVGVLYKRNQNISQGLTIGHILHSTKIIS